MKISIICATLPPQLDGIGDYTTRLALVLAANHEITILTSEENPASIANVRIIKCFDKKIPKSYWGLLDQINADSPDWVVLQYNPFSYGHWGKNLVLPRVMQAVKAQCAGVKTALMVHEPFVPLTGFRFAIMTTWQRWQLWSLGNSADLLFFSIDPWAIRFKRWFPNKKTVHLPVGSNIPKVETSRVEARAKYQIPDTALVLGIFGQAHIARLSDFIHSSAINLHKQGFEVILLYIGPIGQMAHPSLDGIKVITTGRLGSEDVSRALAAIDIYLAAFADGLSSRRSSLMTGLEHGLATVGTSGAHTDDIMLSADGKAFLLSPWKSKDVFIKNVERLSKDATLRNRLAESAREMYNTAFDWPIVGDKMAKSLLEHGNCSDNMSKPAK